MAKLPGIFLFLSLDPLRDPLREKEGEREREICRRNCILAVEFESIIGIDSLICAIFVYLCTLENARECEWSAISLRITVRDRGIIVCAMGHKNAMEDRYVRYY